MFLFGSRTGTQVFWFDFDGDGNRIRFYEADAGTEESTTTFAYDNNGNLESVTDPEGHTTRFTSFDIMGNVPSKTGARGNKWAYD